MVFREISGFNIKNNPQKVQEIITDNAHHFDNILYILKDGNHFEFDTDTRDALNSLMLRIQNVLKNTWQTIKNML